MWRSVMAARASLSKASVLRHLCGAQQIPIFAPFKSPIPILSPIFSATLSSLYQEPRFFSRISTTPSDSDPNVSEPTENGFVAAESEHSSMVFGENDGAQMNDFQNGDGFDGFHEKAHEITDGFDGIQEQALESTEEDNSGVGVVDEIDLEKLENVLSLLQSSPDGGLESSLDELGLNLNQEFLARVAETPLVLGENLIRFFRWGLNQKPELKVTARVVDALVLAICSNLKKKDAYCLWDFIKDIGESEDDGFLNVDSLNVLIAHFSKLGKGKAALEVFDKFGEFGCVANCDTYYFTIEALCRRSIFYSACSVFQKMIDADMLPDRDKVGKIISWFCKGSKAKYAHLLYTLARERKQCPPCNSVNFLIGSLCKEDQTVKLALEILDCFDGEARKYAIKPFSAVIRGLCRMKDVEEARVLLLKMIREGPPPGNAVFNSVINGYAKAGDLEKAVEMIRTMESRGLKPDVYTYTVIMSGYAKGGQMDEACQILSEAKKKHSKLCPVTYHILIRGFCKLEEFDKALKLLNEMKEFGVQATVDEYQKLIQSICLKALDWQTAEKLLEEMKEKGLHLNGITRGLIKAVKELDEEALETVQMITEV